MYSQETPKSTAIAKNSPSTLHNSALHSAGTHNASPLRAFSLNVNGGFKTPQAPFTPTKPVKLLRSTVKRSGGKRLMGNGISTAMTPTRVSPRGISKRGLGQDLSSREWMSTGITPKRGKKVNAHYDRFIPNRAAMCLPSSQLNLARREPGTENYLDPATLAYQEQVAKACGLALDKRILAFKSEPPTAPHDGLRSTYNRPFRTQAASAALRRRILKTPERVLDAPGLVDDYYLNLLDWSCRNTVAVGLDRSVYLWNADTGDVQALCTSRPSDSISSLRWAGDGAYLAVGTSDGDTQIWDIETQAKVRSMLGHQARVGVLSWDKHILSSGCRDGSIHNHDVRVAQHRVAELVAHTAEVCGLTWRSDGQQLASGGNDNLVNIWDARSSIPKYTKPNHKAAVKALAWCPWQANLLASGGGTHDRQIHFWNTTTSARINSIDTGSQVTALIWSKEHREILSAHGYPDNNLSIWAYPSLNKVADIPAHETRVLHTALSPDGQTVATTASDENLKFWKCFESTKSGSGSSKTQSALGRPGRQERAEAAAAAANGSRGGLSARMIR